MPVEDPKDLKRVDQEIHLNELRDQVAKLAGGQDSTFISPDCPPEIQETFLEGILDVERLPVVTSFQQLERAGVQMPEAAALSDAELTAKLWEVIEALARMNTFLSTTNHLSDRQLYELLWTDLLREAGPDFPPDSGWRHHLDVLGSGSEEDIKQHLKYYADEKDRAFWAKEWPDLVIPAHEDPPYDRDRRLPQPPEERPPDEDDPEADGAGEDDLAGV